VLALIFHFGDAASEPPLHRRARDQTRYRHTPWRSLRWSRGLACRYYNATSCYTISVPTRRRRNRRPSPSLLRFRTRRFTLLTANVGCFLRHEKSPTRRYLIRHAGRRWPGGEMDRRTFDPLPVRQPCRATSSLRLALDALQVTPQKQETSSPPLASRTGLLQLGAYITGSHRCRSHSTSARTRQRLPHRLWPSTSRPADNTTLHGPLSGAGRPEATIHRGG